MMQKRQRRETAFDDWDNPNPVQEDDSSVYDPVKREELVEKYDNEREKCWGCLVTLGMGGGRGPNVRNDDLTHIMTIFDTNYGGISKRELGTLIHKEYIKRKIYETELSAGIIRDFWELDMAIRHVERHLTNERIALCDGIAECDFQMRIMNETLYSKTPYGELKPVKAHHKIYQDYMAKKLDYIKQLQASRRNGSG